MIVPISSGRHLRVRPGSALIDPLTQKLNLLLCQWIALFRHSRQIILGSGNSLNDQTLRAFSRDEHWPGIAAFKSCGFLIETQTAFLLFRAMTLVTEFAEDWLDVASEVRLRRCTAVRFGCCCYCFWGGRERQKSRKDDHQQRCSSGDGGKKHQTVYCLKIRV